MNRIGLVLELRATRALAFKGKTIERRIIEYQAGDPVTC